MPYSNLQEDNAMSYPKDTIILSKNKALVGKATGANYHCQMEGCNGLRITTRWENNEITRPCSKGIAWDSESRNFIIS